MNKDGPSVWQSFGHVAAGCLTILEMAVDDYRFFHPLVHLGPVGVHFITRSLSLTIRTDFFGLLVRWSHICSLLQWGCVSMYHICAFLGGSWVSSGYRSIRHRSLQRPWLPLPWEQPDVSGVGSCLLFHLAWDIYVSSGLAKFMQGMMCHIVSAGTSLRW